MALDLSSLEASAEALGRALGIVSDPRRWSAFDDETREILRAGVIQDFEVCYEQGWKMMKRWLARNVGTDDVDGVTRRQLFRLAAQAGLIDDVASWMSFHDARNETSHTYNPARAQAVFETAPALSAEVARLLDRLRARND